MLFFGFSKQTGSQMKLLPPIKALLSSYEYPTPTIWNKNKTKMKNHHVTKIKQELTIFQVYVKLMLNLRLVVV